MSKTAHNENEHALAKSIIIQRTDLSTFDDSFSFLKEKFAAEMKRMDEEITKFSADLRNYYGEGSTTLIPLSSNPAWEALASSPLIQGEGMDKMLKLQFDLSQFEPAEVKVQVQENVLTVQGVHTEKTDNSQVVREFKREFRLPRGTDPNTVISSLSRDGVLTVQAPLPMFATEEEKGQESNVLAKNPSEAKQSKKTAEPKPAVPKPVDESKTTAPPSAQVPQTPLSPVSPASPDNLPLNAGSQPRTPVMSPKAKK